MTKKELEAYAALILIKTKQICEPFSTDWLRDRPDLQIGNFGVEVTEAIDKKDGEQRQLDSKILQCETYENANKYINNLKNPEKYSNEIMRLLSSDSFSVGSGGGYKDKKAIDLIVNAIQDKSSKFLKYPDYKIFLRKGLYIFDRELRPGMQLLDIELIRKMLIDSVFDVLFVHQCNRLIVVEKDDKITKEYTLDTIYKNEVICEAKRVCDSPDYKVCCERAKSYRESKDY